MPDILIISNNSMISMHRALRLLIITVALSSCTPHESASSWSAVQSEWQSHRAKGVEAFKQRDFSSAEQEFAQALDIVLAKKDAASSWNPVSDRCLDALAGVQSQNDLSQTYAAQGNPQKGSALIKQSLMMSTDLAEKLKQAGETGDSYENAVIEEIRSLDSMAMMRASLGYYSEAETFFKKAKALMPELKDASKVPVALDDHLQQTTARREEEETQFSKLGDHVPDRKAAKRKKHKHKSGQDRAEAPGRWQDFAY